MNEPIPVEAQKAIDETAILVKSFENFQIATAEIYTGAGEHLKRIKTRFKEVDDLRKSLTKPLDESKKRIMELFQKPLDLLAEAERSIKFAMLGWQTEQERIRREEELKLQEAARKEEERQRKVKEEQERAWREKEEAARKEADRLAAKGKAEEAARARAEANRAALKANQRAQEAQEVFVPVPVVNSTVEKIAGINNRTIWKFRIVDANKIPRQYMIPNEKMLGEIARTLKGSLAIDGVDFYPENIMSSKS